MPAQTTNMTLKRLRILGDDEIEALYGRPRFTDDKRREYFSLSATEKVLLEQFPQARRSLRRQRIPVGLPHHDRRHRTVRPRPTARKST